MARLKSCPYCGKVHDMVYLCPKKPVRKKKNTDKDKFRNTQAWQDKREEIRERDAYLCQVCIRKLYDTHKQYNYNDLGVHHAEPLETAYDKRLDNDNLITICDRHHEMAERGEIPVRVVLDIIAEQERKHTPRGRG